ncbi:MAG: AAA family ATPase [Desulfobacterales bacterium]|nr:AAA family ATPase [Desulfobacterales bacterium]
MYTQFYEFDEKPFKLVPDPNYLFLSSRHEKALTFLEYGLSERVGFVMLTGEIGIGKTTLIRHLLNQVETDMDVAVVFHTNVDAATLLRQILTEFEIEYPDAMDKAGLLDLLYEYLIDRYRKNRKVFVIVDEAQNLSNDALEEVRMLSNLQTDKEMLLNVLVVGQPNLRTKIQSPGLEQFAQRIAASFHMSAMTLEETGAYIHHRLETAGGPTGLFQPDLVRGIFDASAGIPRTINLLCDALLVYGYADRTKILTRELLDQVIQDREGMGVFIPSGDGEEPAQEEEHPESLSLKMAALETRVSFLSDAMENRLKDTESRADFCRDELVARLTKLYQDEKKKNDALIFRYGKLKEKYDRLQQASADSHEPILLKTIAQ